MPIRPYSRNGQRHVAVTGLGAVTPAGHDVPALWKSALAGVRPFKLVDRFSTENLPTRICAPVEDGWEQRLPSSVRFRYDRHAWFAKVAADEALADAGLELSALDLTHVGVAMGTAHGPLAALEEQWSRLAGVPEALWTEEISAYLMSHASLNTACAVVAISYELQGPSIGVATACAAGASALGEAADAIRIGRAEVIVAGAADAAITRTAFHGYGKIRAMSERNHDPQGALRPFDIDREGFVMGEGGAVLVLEELEHARARGARIYAMLMGYGAASDSHHLTNIHPTGRGLQTALRMAMRDAEVAPEQIALVNSHGSGTRVNDLIESHALRTVFGTHRLNVQSSKPLTGHLMGAAGSIEAILTVLQIYNGIVLPTLNCVVQDPACDIDVYTGDPREESLGVALTCSAGFGGPDACLVLRARP